VLSRLDREGNLRWRRVIRTGGESTELSTLNELVVDQAGNIAGIGATFNDNLQQAYLFRYDPNADSLLYFLQPDFISSELTGIKILNDNEYLVLGSRLGEAFPVFISAYSQQVNQADGQPSQAAIRYDYLGDESFLDASLAPDGTRYIVGNISATGGAGDIRASVSRIAADGTPEWTKFGPVGGDVNGRLYAFDVELIGNQLFVLHWGNIGNITGGVNTTIYLSCLDPSTGAVFWNRSYDITDFEGESGIELQPYNGGLLVYGLSLARKRDPWLMQLRLTGEVDWARSYEVPGNALVYLRANQQLHTDDTGITALASFSYADGTPRKGLVLRLAPNGQSDAGCLNVRSLEVSVEPLISDWQAASLETNELATTWNDVAIGMEEASFTGVDDCNTNCEDCSVRSLNQIFVCREDSVFVAGAFRSEAGVYADTLPSSVIGCDSIQFTEVVISDGPTASYSVRRECGLAEAEVRINANGVALPLSYSWSASGENGNTAYLPAGNYQVTVNDAIECRPLVIEVVVEEVTRGNASLQITPPNCPGDSTGIISLNPPGSGGLRLFPAPNFVPDVLTGLPAGAYQLIVRDSTGCEVFRQVSVPPADPVSVGITGPQRVRLGDETLLAPASGPDQNFVAHNWTLPNGSTSQDFSLGIQPTEDGTYHLTSITDLGCIATDSILLNVYRAAPRLYLPTAFSPNDDGLNDSFVPGIGPEIVRITKWEIFDRWGNLHWALTDENWWTGKEATPGVYVYHLEALLIDGSLVSLSGQITLLR
jgi:hypothetical protein